MARQRHGQSRGDAGRRRGRGRWLALAVLAAALAAAGCPSTPGPLGPWIGNAGGGAGGGATPSLVGTWRNLLATPTSVTDTRWTFGADGRCDRTVIKTLLESGLQDSTSRGCRYTLAGASLSVVFDGSSFVSTFSVAFANGDLFLDGFRFRKIA